MMSMISQRLLLLEIQHSSSQALTKRSVSQKARRLLLVLKLRPPVGPDGETASTDVHSIDRPKRSLASRKDEFGIHRRGALGHTNVRPWIPIQKRREKHPPASPGHRGEGEESKMVTHSWTAELHRRRKNTLNPLLSHYYEHRSEEESEILKRINAAIEVAAAVLVSSESCPDSELLAAAAARSEGNNGVIEMESWKQGKKRRRRGHRLAV
ncbi:hypothetical protein GUJ93_ZPchr0013g34451 [Zizania palustris]|uniref:Uncharacterized protein n=1 Tax=Zizania palustris TaxID=103762 RepID=A0A8J6BUR6_ZIZPA|nr:hypothetical protein GUJ93_ZPchr0013g34451 [Zizania palustris]